MENTDLVLYKSAVISDAGANGGRMSSSLVTSNVLNNMFPNITQTERTSGKTRYRKFFFKNKNSANELASTSRFWISKRSNGGDYFRIKAGSNVDTQADSTAYTDWLGTGYLSVAINPDDTSFTVVFDAPTGVYNSSVIRLSDSSGGEEFLTIVAAGGVSWIGNTATIVTTSGAQGSYPATEYGLVCGVVELDSIIASADTFVVTSVSGTYDDTTFPILISNIGTVEDTWTLSFTSPTAFTVTGTNTGSLGSGTRSSDFSPVNPNIGTGAYYFSIRASGFGGTFVIGETITFSTHHSAKSIWAKEIAPALTSAESANRFNFKLYAEGA